jgi:phospholipid/cholesterol/gamma-HCH transport system ATP-binding protein
MGQPDQPDTPPDQRPDPPSDAPTGSEFDELLSEKIEDGDNPTVPQPAPTGPSVPIISFNHVSISFGDRKILDNVSFTLARGQTLCILGRSGVGKSVSLRILMGFLKPQIGSIRVEGEEINGLDEDGMQAIRKRVTMVFQNGALFDSLTVRENIAFPLRERGGMAEDQIQQIVDRLTGLVGAEDVTNDLPGSLSTGRKRAVAIARALAAQPEVVLYDEPTTMVDPIIAKRLGSLIQKLKYQLGYTSIIVTHDMRFAERLADQVLFLHQGKASFFGPLNKFLASPDENIQQFLALDAYRIPSA